MEERGFDQLQQGAGAVLLVLSTILLLGLIFAGGIWMQKREQRDREAERQEREGVTDPQPYGPNGASGPSV